MTDMQPDSGPFRKLKEKFNKRGFEYRLVKRSDKVAMYEQWADERLHAYEVFRIQVNDAYVIGGRAVTAGESPASDETWGKKGWTCLTREAAEQRYEAAHVVLEEVAEEAAEETPEEAIDETGAPPEPAEEPEEEPEAPA